MAHGWGLRLQEGCHRSIMGLETMGNKAEIRPVAALGQHPFMIELGTGGLYTIIFAAGREQPECTGGPQGDEAMRKPTPNDADLLLKLYDLRREALLRT